MSRAAAHKLKGCGGETLVEALAAILVVGLASAGLAAMITAGAHMNRAAAEAGDDLRKAVLSAERREKPTDVQSGTATVTVTYPDAGRSYVVGVVAYGKEGICSYEASEPEP